MEMPRLETERLILRRIERADAPVVQRLAGDAGVAEMTLNIPHPYPDGAAEAWIMASHARIAEGTDFPFGVERKADGALIGCIGLTCKPAHVKAELGYWIGRPYWGRGYATEGARRVLRFGFEGLQLNRIYAAYFTKNPASGRVQEKLGMKCEGTRRQDVLKWGEFLDLTMTSLLRSEFTP